VVTFVYVCGKRGGSGASFEAYLVASYGRHRVQLSVCVESVCPSLLEADLLLKASGLSGMAFHPAQCLRRREQAEEARIYAATAAL
jgi:hypothetical protein